MLILKRSVVAAGAVLLILTGGLAEAGNGNQGGGGGWGPPAAEISCDQVLEDYFDGLPVSDLDGETIDAITLLREEEKMARDLYLEMSLLYDMSIFSNIARSEQHHMDLVAKLLDRHGIPDPAVGLPIGEFNDDWVQGTYDALKEIGEQNLIDALWVGSTVEDVDIWHLDHIVEHSLAHGYLDVAMIVQNMDAGSRNHMRSFVPAYEKRSPDPYVAQYIEQDYLREIVESEMETAVILDEYGDVLAECGLAESLRRLILPHH